MSAKSGIIYELEEGRFGLAIHKEQSEAFLKIGKAYLHIFKDRLCTIPELDPGTGKKYVTLKAFEKLIMVGYSD